MQNGYFLCTGKQQFFIGDLKLNRNISSIKYKLKFTSYTWHQIINWYMSTNCLDILNLNKKNIYDLNLNGSVCIKLLLLIRLF